MNEIIEKTNLADEYSQRNIRIGSESSKLIRRDLIQIWDTVSFDFQRKFHGFIAMIIMETVIFALSLVINILSHTSEMAATPERYIEGFLGFSSYMAIIIAVVHGGNMLGIDFELDTGNLLFPKISRSKLYIGRLLSALIMIALELLYFYIIIGVAALIKVGGIPKVHWESMGYFYLYVVMCLIMVIMFTMIIKKSSMAIVVSIILLFIGFSLVQSIVNLLSTAEPWYLPIYYGNIISFIYNFPETIEGRRLIMEIPVSEDMTFTTTTWFTPTPTVALCGMIAYIMLFMVISVIIYNRKQANGN